MAGNPIEKDLESRAGGEMQGNVAALMQAPFFYTSPNTAQVHLGVEIPSAALKFEKVKGKQHAAINILGIAYKPDASIAARFSDTVNVDFEDKKQVEEFQKQPFHYENQFGVASGEYKLKVVFSSGNESFGKLETPLSIDPYRGQEFSISGVALSNDIRRAADISTGSGQPTAGRQNSFGGAGLCRFHRLRPTISRRPTLPPSTPRSTSRS